MLSFKYNPPVVFVNMMLSGGSADVRGVLVPALMLWYPGQKDLVGRFDSNIDDSLTISQVFEVTVKLGPKTTPKPVNQRLAQFLKSHPLTKIVILVDSHSVDDGGIAEKVSKTGVTSSDTLGQVRLHASAFHQLTPCTKVLLKNLPREIEAIIDAKTDEQFYHQVLVINHTCGDSVLLEKARNSLLSE
jgi:hypothetical protein